MIIYDIFSWLQEKELSLDTIEDITCKLYAGTFETEEYKLEMELPIGVNNNIIEATNELLEEDKKVCYLLRSGIVIAVVGYRL